MFRPKRPPRWFVQRDIQILVRSFPSERLVVFRLGEPTTSGDTLDLGEPSYQEYTVFDGEALFIPAGGTVARFGLGEVEEDKPQVLISGWHDIQQGDRVRRIPMNPDGSEGAIRLYTVQYAPNPWLGFTHITLENFGQGPQ